MLVISEWSCKSSIVSVTGEAVIAYYMAKDNNKGRVGLVLKKGRFHSFPKGQMFLGLGFSDGLEYAYFWGLLQKTSKNTFSKTELT